jgi:hypothetical protein
MSTEVFEPTAGVGLGRLDTTEEPFKYFPQLRALAGGQVLQEVLFKG